MTPCPNQQLEGRDSNLKTTFGWARVGVVGSLTSLAFLGSLSFATSIECLQTLAHSGHLDTMHQPFWVGVLAGCHVAVWLVVFCLAGGYTFQQCVVIGTSPAGDPSLRIPHSPSDCTSEGCQSETDDITVAFWRKVDRLVNVPFSYVFRDLAGIGIYVATIE